MQTRPSRTEGSRRVPSGRAANADLTRPRALIIGFLAPALLPYLAFFIYPMLRSVYLSLFRGSLQSGQFTFVAFENYRKLLFEDPMFWRCVAHNLAFVFVSGALTLLFGLAIALALTRIQRGRAVFRVIYLFPHVMAVVAVTILWSFVYNPSFGLLNGMLHTLHLDHLAHAWLGEPNTALAALILAHVWMQVGFYVILFQAGLLRIPAEYLEAARIDGAGPVQEFRHVTLPLLSEITRISMIYVTISALSVFALVYLVNEGEPNKYNEVLMTYLYRQGLRNGQFGYASAIAVAVVVLVLFAGWLVNRIFADKTVEI